MQFIIENLEKFKINQVKPAAIADYCYYFNRKLIVSEIKEHFNQLYGRCYKCLICYDVIFDPVYCSDCRIVFCKNCISNVNKNNNLLCSHTTISKELPAEKILDFEQIKVNCFFKCDNKNLNLLTYPDHLIICKEKYDRNISSLNEKKDSKKDINITLLLKERALNVNFLEQIDKLKLELKEKVRTVERFTNKYIASELESIELKQSINKTKENYEEVRERYEITTDELTIVKGMLLNKVKDYDKIFIVEKKNITCYRL